MNNKISLKFFEIISTFFTIIVGSLLHFTYNWSNHNPIMAIFSSTNESTWEHLKILFIPMLITTIVGFFYNKNIDNYLCSKTKGILLSLSFIVIFFYTYTGIIGTHFPVIDILSFIASIILGEIYTYQKIQSNASCNNKLSIIILIVLAISFTIFTFNPPHLGIFKDPVTETYGIQNN